jgi:hypothetical protein
MMVNMGAGLVHGSADDLLVVRTPPINFGPMKKLALLVAVSSLGCGNLIPLPAHDAKCDLRPKKDQCTDIRGFKGPSLVTFEGVCATLKSATGGGTYTADATCDSSASLGGCQSSSLDGSKQTNWYYRGTKYADAAAAMAECDSGQTFVTP